MKKRINPNTFEVVCFAQTPEDLTEKPTAKDCTNGLKIWKNQKYNKYKKTLLDDLLTCDCKYKKLKKVTGNYYIIVEMSSQEKKKVDKISIDEKWAKIDAKVDFLLRCSDRVFVTDFAPTENISKIDKDRVKDWRLQLSTIRVNFTDPYDPTLKDLLKPKNVVFTEPKITNFFMDLFDG